MNKYFFSFLFYLVLNQFSVVANTSDSLALKGLPLIQEYSSDHFEAGTQNWDMEEDIHGVKYFANSKGVLVFDGVEWTLIELPNKGGVTSLLFKDQKLFIGGQGEIGYFQYTSLGVWSYHSLVEFLPLEYRDFKGVYDIHLVDNVIFFSSRRLIIALEEGDMRIFEPVGDYFSASFVLEGAFYVQDFPAGVLKWDAREFQQQEQFKELGKVELLSGFDGDGKYTFFTRNQEIFTFQKEGAFNKITKNKSLKGDWYSIAQIKGGLYAIGTLNNGLIILDKSFSLLYELNRSSGLQSDLVWSVNLDGNGNVWSAYDGFLVCFQFSNPQTFLPTPGVVFSSIVFDDYLFLGTSSGVYSTPLKNHDNVIYRDSQFSLVKGTEGQAWHFFEQDNKLYCAHSDGLFQLNHKKSKKLLEGFYWSVLNLPTDETKWIGGTYNKGLVLIQKDKNQYHTKEIGGLKISARYLALENDTTIWFSNPYKGVYKAVLDLQNDSVITVQKYGVLSGLPDSTFNFIYAVSVDSLKGNQQILAATHDGIYQYNKSADRFFLVKTDSLTPLGATKRIIQGFDDQLFFTTENGLRVLKGDTVNPVYLPVKNTKDIYHVNVISKDHLLVSTPHHTILVNSRVSQNENKSLSRTLVSRFQTQDLKIEDYYNWGLIHQGEEQMLQISYPVKELSFFSTVPEVGINSVEFRYRLYKEGEPEEDWSSWSTDEKKEYSSLSPGIYQFEVQSRSLGKQLNELYGLRFEVLEPWYLSVWAYLFYLVCLGSFIFLGFKYYAKQLQRENERLELLVKQRTEEVSTQNEQIQKQKESIALQNIHLTELNDEKNNLIGVLAHDMRNPLSQIKGLISLVTMTSNPNEESKEYLGLMGKSVERLNNMIERILDVEAIENKELNMTLVNISVNVLLKQVMTSFEEVGNNKQIGLAMDLSSEVKEINVDHDYFLQIMENLVSNAIKFSPAQSKVTISSNINSENQVLISVIDEGPGISDADKKKLFGKFQRLSAKPTGGEKSTGLGLSIVKKFVEGMGGDIFVESELGKGTTFSVVFPSASE